MGRVVWACVGFVVLAGLFAAYLLGDHLQAVPGLGWSTPSLRTARDMSPEITYHIITTASRSVFILVGGCALACIFAWVSHASRTSALSDLMSIIAAVPPLVWVPLSLAAFGLHEWAFTIPGILFTGALLAPSLVAQVFTVPASSVEMLVVLGRSPGQIGKAIYLPHLIGGMAPHVALAFALLFGMSAVVEYLAGFDGIGRVLRSLSFAYEMRGLFLVTAVTTFLLWGAQALLRRALLSVQSLL